MEARSQYNGLLTKAEGGSGGITVHIDRIGTVAVSKKERLLAALFAERHRFDTKNKLLPRKANSAERSRYV